jgi:GTPase SAR1 family protein
MAVYNSLKNDLLCINSDILSLFSNAKSIPGMPERAFEDWENTCMGIKRQMSEDIIRVAVIGSVKSGKSTFVNSLFKGDYLKRGAGIVTSIVTKVHSGKRLNATLYFKSWEEVNSDMEQAMVLFPSLSWSSEDNRFDIRQSKDREKLQDALGTLSSEQLITQDTRNINCVLLTSYLKGYSRVCDIISSDTTIKQYAGDLFPEHRAFAGDEVMAVFLKDIKLEICSDNIDQNIEIADCQGSDSPNPLHLIMIQNYLLLTHLLVYVISSRTGLRRADVRFLTMIKKMGIIDNIIFVINCDFFEHKSLDDMKTLIGKVKDELSFIKPDPEVYSFSGLFNLFRAQKSELSEKDRVRLEQWEKEKDFSAYSDRETSFFESALNNRITRERYTLLLENHLGRLTIISSGLDNWISINRDILAKDAASANDVIRDIKRHQKKMGRIKAMIKSTLDGAVQKISSDLKNDVDKFFDTKSGDILSSTIEFIRAYNVSFEQYEESLKISGFSNTLHMVHQEFKQALDFFMAETITPRVIGFVKTLEDRIGDYIKTIAGSYNVMVKDALLEYKNTMEQLGISLNQENYDESKMPDIEAIKGSKGLNLPPTAEIMRYTAVIRTEAIMRLGFYNVAGFIKKLLKKPATQEKEEEFLALKDAVLRIKRETEKSMAFHFKSYKENVKFQYVFKLVEAVSNSYYEVLLDRFQAYFADLSRIGKLVEEKKIDKKQVSETLNEMEITFNNINGRVNQFQENIRMSV